MIENNKEYKFTDFLVYNKYININLPDMDVPVAEYAIIFMYQLYLCINYIYVSIIFMTL